MDPTHAALFRAAFEHSRQLLGLLTVEGIVLEINPTALQLAATTLEQVQGLPFWETPWWRHDSRERERLMEGLRRAASGETYKGLTEQVDAHGSKLVIDFRLSPLRNEAGHVETLLAEGEDVTELQQERERLARSEQRFRVLVERAPEAILVTDPATGCIVTANGNAEALFGAPPGGLLALGAESLSPEFQPDGRSSQERRAELVRKVMDEDLPPFEWMHRTLDGSPLPTEVRLAALPSEAGVLIRASIVDIRDRLEKERALRESERRLQWALGATSEAVWEYDVPSGRTYYSPRWFEMLDLNLDDWTPHPDAWKSLCHPEDLAEALELARRGLEGPSHTFRAEVRMRRRDGWRWIQAQGRAVAFDPDGSIRTVAGTCADITEHRELDERLRQSHAQMEGILRVAPVGVFQSSPGGQYAFANPALARILGYDTPEELVEATRTQGIAETLYPDPSLRERLIRSVVANPGTWCSLETPFIRKDGSPVETLFTMASHPDSRSGELGLYGYVVDISERKRMEEALQHSHAQLEKLFRMAPVGVFQSTPEGRFRFVNPAIARILGWESAEELLEATERRGIASCLYPDPELRKRIVGPIFATPGSWKSIDHTFLRKDGSTVDTLFTMTSQRDPATGELGLYGYVVDISERKAMEEAIRRSHAQLQSLFENAPVGLIKSTLDGQFRFLNPALARILGYDSAEELAEAVRRRSIAEVLYADPSRREGLLGEVQAEEGAWRTFDLQFRCRDGSTREVLSTITQQRDPLSGEPSLYAFVVDFTELRHAERDRLELERRILHTQKLESLGLLAGGIAHDFNNLLTAMLGNINLAQANQESGIPATRNLLALERAVRKASELTRQMLAYSGRGRFIVRAHDLSAVIREMADLLGASISKKIRLELELGESLPPLEADAAQLQQVVLNLVTNASDAIGPGEGTIRMATRARHMEAFELAPLLPDSDLPPGTYLELEVADTGCGIPEELRARIFDPFFTTKETGHGLGLSAMLGILRGHRGGLAVESEPGAGTRFRLYFPAGKALPEVAAETPVPAQAGGGGLVLLVDDEPVVREVAAEALKAMGLDVVEAGDGQEALERFREHRDRLALVFMDLTMPRMSGREAFEAMRALNPDVPVLLSSGFDGSACVQDILSQGLALFLQKPYALAELRRIVSSMLRRA